MPEDRAPDKEVGISPSDGEYGKIGEVKPIRDVGIFDSWRKSPVRGRPKAFDLRKQPDLIKEVVRCFIEDPDRNPRDIAKELRIPIKSIKYLMRDNRYLYALRMIASNKFTKYIPLALKGFRECLLTSNMEVKLRACTKVLENENILGPTRVDLSVNDLRDRPIEEIDRIIKAGQALGEQTILNAELIGS